MKAQDLLKRIERKGCRAIRTKDLVAAKRIIEELKRAKETPTESPS